MGFHKTGCLVCGNNLQYFDRPKTLQCEICGKEFQSDVSCDDNHFICDQCHAQPGFESITSNALRAKSNDPAAIAREMMENEFINMHGPEHHYLVVAALLAAYKNAGGALDLEKSLALARQRAEKVPGGVCGNWGACGAGIGAGIFISLVTGATPLSIDQWSLANQMTARSLEAIARHGGPRCCKRDTWLSILTAVDFVGERLGVNMAKAESTQCSFFGNNPSCRKQDCLFYPPADNA